PLTLASLSRAGSSTALATALGITIETADWQPAGRWFTGRVCHDLPHNLVGQVGGVWRVLMGDELQPCRLAPVVEEAGPRAEQDRGQIQAEAVDQAGVHGLPDDARAAHDGDQLVAGRVGGAADGRGYTVRDEGKCRRALDHRLVGPVRDDEDRHLVKPDLDGGAARLVWRKQMPVLPPAAGVLVHPAAGDHRATSGEVIIQEPAALLVVGPGVQRLAALPEPRALLDSRSGDVAVQRHRDIRFYKRHRGNPSALASARYGPLASTDVPDGGTHRSFAAQTHRRPGPVRERSRQNGPGLTPGGTGEAP